MYDTHKYAPFVKDAVEKISILKI